MLSEKSNSEHISRIHQTLLSDGSYTSVQQAEPGTLGDTDSALLLQ